MSQSKTLFRRGSQVRPAPSPVRWAIWLLYVSGLLTLVSVLEVILEGSPNGTFALNATIGIVVPVVLARLVSLGYRWARTAVWVWTAILTVTAGIFAAVRAWDLALMLPVIVGLSLPVGASVLLAIPRSNQYFRRT